MSHLINVEINIRAPREAVFDRLSDHARYRDFPGVTASELLTRGQPDANGTGAVRMIRASGGVRFVEKIGEFERPDFYKYLITESTIPMKHIDGEVRLTEQGGVTHVVWRSEFELRVPLLGRVVRKVGADGFLTILKAVKRELE